jgi:hypothetical protein
MNDVGSAKENPKYIRVSHAAIVRMMLSRELIICRLFSATSRTT